MSITQEQKKISQDKQNEAAHDPNQIIRLVAGPGTGKSFSIQERVLWLMQNGIAPNHIYVVSFTRASTKDLQTRITNYCKDNGMDFVERVSISTLHSLALRALRMAGLLTYPANPLVLDKWEQKNIIDEEFSVQSRINGNYYPPSRCFKIRENYEAFCGTGSWNPPNYISPTPAISDAERNQYQHFHNPRTQIYSCVLPGEIIRQCNINMENGALNPIDLLQMEYLIVDEYQDLNPADIKFIDWLIINGLNVFVAGDDDQSLYSFRYATPSGIRTITNRFQDVSQHVLNDCFRSTVSIIDTANTLIEEFSEENRIPKHINSLYENSNPPEQGVVKRWRFFDSIVESRSIAESCNKLITNGLPPENILVLVSSKDALLKNITDALELYGVDFEAPKKHTFIETQHGKFIHGLLRVICDHEDYVALRLLLGCRPNVGSRTCNNIAKKVFSHNLNYWNIFSMPLPDAVFDTREATAIRTTQSIIQVILQWEKDSIFEQHRQEITSILQNIYPHEIIEEWESIIAILPNESTIEEVRDFLWSETDEHKTLVLESIYKRLHMPLPDEGFVPKKVRIMTMHGAKGLSSDIVFIPGLMEEILPGEKRAPYPGLVYEAARMLYVSITRARLCCVLSFAESRTVFGSYIRQHRSRYVPFLGGPFSNQQNGMNDQEILTILQRKQNL